MYVNQVKNMVGVTGNTDFGYLVSWEVLKVVTSD